MILKVIRTNLLIKPNVSRVVVRPFNLSDESRIVRILARLASLSETEVEQQLALVREEFKERHLAPQSFFRRRFREVSRHLITDAPMSEARQELIGSYFTMEFSLESAALFNPSIVWHPDQSGLSDGNRRFVLSLRATGEGHLSSITFRSGTISADHQISMEPASRYVSAPQVVHDAEFKSDLFRKKLFEMGIMGSFVGEVLTELGDSFTMDKLLAVIERQTDRHRYQDNKIHTQARAMRTLAESNYTIEYSPEQRLSERIIFPNAPSERNGIEDARFVEFHDGSEIVYYATYSAYDGSLVLPQIIETRDFLRFNISTLNGPAVQNKGFALFPRKINGQYVMLGRQDGENIYLMDSDMLHFWHDKQLLLRPTYPWEFVQLGNCGSPIETEAGWLVLSHGVGAMRKYAIGAFLLDLNDPSKVLGRLKEPLLTPDGNEREGYVPNVVYSCGALVHNGMLVIPYAMSDYASSFAMVSMKELLDEIIS